jgi:nucleotide-binding universal stress UspA family protein
MIKLETIVCPTDFSDFSRRALDHATAVAGWYRARIQVVHVVPVLRPGGAESVYYPSWMALNPGARQEICAELRRFVEPVRAAGVPVEFSLREGDVVRRVVDEVRGLEADLLVMGTHGRGGFERWVLGSVTEKIIRKASCPVMTIPAADEAPPQRPLFKRILCAMDFSEPSLAALRFALSLSQEAAAHLTVLHVLEWPSDETASQKAYDVSDYRSYLESEARARLRRIVPEGSRDWCEIDEVLAFGKSYPELLRVAQEDRSELIVMGVHGRNALDLMLFGSTTHHVVRSATCPVLTIRT